MSSWRAVISDAVRASLARPLPTAVCALVIALVCVVALLTTGRAAATEARIVASIDSVGTRLIVLTDTTGNAGIFTNSVKLVADLDSVEWVFGVGPAVPVTNSTVGYVMGESMTARPLIGSLPSDVRLTSGRGLAAPNESLVATSSRQGLGLTDTAGRLQTNERVLANVGSFEATGAASNLGADVLYQPDPSTETPIRYLYVLAAEGADVIQLGTVLEEVLPAEQPSMVDVEVSTQAIELRDVVTGALGAGSRQLMIIVLSVGCALVAITMAGSTSGRRRDFGRQRALGATRALIVTSVVVHALVAGLIGTAIGTVTGLTFNLLTTGQMISGRFFVGLATIMLYVTVAGAIVPAVIASRRDPVRILRVP